MKAGFLKKIQWSFKNWQQFALPGLSIVGLVVLVRLSGALQMLEWGAFDRFMRYRPIEPVDRRVVIVGVTEEDIRHVGYPVPDGELAQLITKLNSYKPRAIGLDIFRDLPVQPGEAELVKIFKTTRNVIGIEKSILPDAQNSIVNPPPELPTTQVGFADVILDRDGNVRRSLIASPRLNGGYQFSLGLRLAEAYLKAEGIEIDNGIKDKNAIRFGTVEFPRLQPHDGGYIGVDAGGNQILMNWRSGQKRFPMFSLKDIKTNNFNADAIRDRIVIIGMVAASVKDTLTAPAVNEDLVEGVEYQAHSTSQIISAVLDGRSLLQVLPDAWEYVLIIFWGGAGIAIGNIRRRTNTPAQERDSPIPNLLMMTAITISLVAGCYGLLLLGWWVPVIPTIFAFVGAGLVTRYIQDLRSLIEQRQLMLEQRQNTLDDAFNALHNGPLQTLAGILSSLRTDGLEPQVIGVKLESLDRELRQVYESLRPERLAKQGAAPLHELLYEVYHNTLQRDFAGFKGLKIKLPNINPVEDFYLTAEHKHELSLFLEEALCNVGKHARDATQLRVICKQENGWCSLRVVDNGAGISPTQTIVEQGGTKLAKSLAKKLGGSFTRSPNTPKGTICELTWPVGKT
ncbi:CHASE2 domain-containing protein [Pseudanabaena sp. PCC 6802]|uniref:sensor histidine kinase n=1 Tax=Pseudanabaena sp. PCC 6802 TaxID=118173 RepID=UPI000345ED1D|nr:CHASE2 domain-containing protein [Pseudanabaena sp. PCC 6802]